ncbi:low specificity L-threonine aldolase [Ktedonosporobacter rubrisoli]|uniref:Low specificity L-threonine aldolase n=1 Tax=Ktedonosporobacter rubrisoli TaxID=2509675 RepID=A0A4P6JXH3_KTERU|nr:GntG family PLP-dependent aldolase [Ktedonosporobacter rubrisoli]QBD80070.1 low specificity L-threonine aldolase [Ktedonosporobacter rubrisoli]
MDPSITVDLYSDTITQPTTAMRQYMCYAEVGDEQLGEDPSVNRLQAMVADMLGKEAGLYLPSGTMCNQIAYAVHCQPGDEVIMDRTAHPLHFEGGGPTPLKGILVRALAGDRGVFTADQLTEALRPHSRYQPRSKAISIEQTSNLGGGRCWPLASIREVCERAHSAGLATHMDGARLLNAVVATGVAASDYASSFDSVWLDLSKGLGAPVGAVLAGSRSFIQEAWRYKQLLGGAMRQSGIMAAAGIYALEHHVERLAEDHTHAQLLAQGLAGLPGIALRPQDVETNIVLFDVAETALSGQQFVEHLKQQGVRFSLMGPSLVRAVTHLQIARDDIEYALQAVEAVLDSSQKNKGSKEILYSGFSS